MMADESDHHQYALLITGVSPPVAAGSSNLWVPSASCSSSCGDKPKYNSGASSTYEKVRRSFIVPTQPPQLQL
jgi:hypothetical protein